MKNRKGFTLIELLVVIAIIALLLSIILPSLGAAKELASGAVCVAHQRQLCTAWIAYAQENNSYMVGGSNYTSTPHRWVEYPINNDGSWSSDPSEYSLETRKNGIRAGKLFPYTQDVDLYHCSGDKKFVKNPEPYATFRSYSITGLMNGEDFASKTGDTFTYRRAVTSPGTPAKELRLVVKTTEIRAPGNKHVFVEEDCGDQKVNAGSFVLLDGAAYDWWDVPADYHNGSSTTGFADGHAERRRWQDSDTIKLIKGEIKSDPDAPNNEDLRWMASGYLPRP